MAAQTPAQQLAVFINRYTPAMAKAIRGCRQRVRKFFPRGYEQIYDNYNFLGLGYGSGQKAPDNIISIVAYPRYIRLFFLQGGTKLQDKHGLLEGTGSQVRSIKLASPQDLDKPAVKQLIRQALAGHKQALARCPRLKTIIKAVAAKQLSRRPDKNRH